MAERPNFIELKALKALACEVVERLILVGRERLAGILQHLDDGVLARAPVIRTIARMLLPSTIIPRI